MPSPIRTLAWTTGVKASTAFFHKNSCSDVSFLIILNPTLYYFYSTLPQFLQKLLASLWPRGGGGPAYSLVYVDIDIYAYDILVKRFFYLRISTG